MGPGVYLSEPAQDGKDLAFKGSIIVAIGDTKEDVLKVLKQDVYSKNDVWDWDKVISSPLPPFFLCLCAPLC